MLQKQECFLLINICHLRRTLFWEKCRVICENLAVGLDKPRMTHWGVTMEVACNHYLHCLCILCFNSSTVTKAYLARLMNSNVCRPIFYKIPYFVMYELIFHQCFLLTPFLKLIQFGLYFLRAWG